ncbi:MAG: pentapeptide repeat-containing protein [Microcella pacifica]
MYPRLLPRRWRRGGRSIEKLLTATILLDLLGLDHLWGADLRDANLWGANLRGANLWGADLRDANLWGANLRGANLWGADLRDANLWGANLWDANLWDANLRDANLRGADLRDANLRGANLRGADLRGANLWGGMPISTPSGSGYLVPTAEGWQVTIGCWRNHSLDDLRALVETDADWPEATGAERDRRRPILAAVLTLCEAHAVYHADKLAAVVEKWGAK